MEERGVRSSAIIEQNQNAEEKDKTITLAAVFCTPYESLPRLDRSALSDGREAWSASKFAYRKSQSARPELERIIQLVDNW